MKPHCARCHAELLAGDCFHSGQLVALDHSFTAFFELCTPCHTALQDNEALRAELHVTLRNQIRDLLLLVGSSPGGRA